MAAKAEQRRVLPYKVDREGIVALRSSGEVIGMVRLDAKKGWTAYVRDDRYGPHFPWTEVMTRHWNGRKYAAQAVWNQHRHTLDEEATDGEN